MCLVFVPTPFTDIESPFSDFSVKDHKVVSMPFIVKVPKCYVPQVPIPRVPVTDDFGDCSFASDSSGSAGPEKDGDTDNESKVNIRSDFIPRVSVTEDFEDFSLISNLSGPGGLEKDGKSEKDGNSDDENKVNIRASSIQRPRAVVSSPGKSHISSNFCLFSYIYLFTSFFLQFECLIITKG